MRSPEDVSMVARRSTARARRVAGLLGPVFLLLGSLAVIVVNAAGFEIATAGLIAATFSATVAIAAMVVKARQP